MTQQAHKLSVRTPTTVRQSLYVPPLLLVLLLFLCCANVCVAWDDGMRRCMFDDMINTSGMHSVGVVREVPRKGQSGMQAYTVATQEDWKLIRIVTSTKDLENSSRYCTATDQEVMNFQGGTEPCTSSQILTKEKKKTLLHDIIPAAVKLHADRLLVQPMKGKLIVPRFEDGSYCNHFTVPEEHRSEGVTNADFVLYVAAGLGRPFGVTCTAVEPSGRPIAGAMNFPPYYQVDPRVNVRLAAHEMAHALGFNVFSMEKKGLLTHANLRGKNRPVVSSKMSRKKAQTHYGCPDLQGMLLEDDESVDGEMGSHWAKRVAKDELMAPVEEDDVGIYYTALTMALFEDLQYYKANWGMEEPMSWGNQKGCSFISGACMNNRVSIYPEMFCNTSASRCTSNRYALGERELVDEGNEGSDVDFCPVVIGNSGVDYGGEIEFSSFCTLGVESSFPGSLIGSDSWCLDGEGLRVQRTGSRAASVADGVCARVQCSRDGGVKVRYRGNDKWHDCPEGTSINGKSPTFQAGGKIKCPKYTEVCTVTPDGSSRLGVKVEPDGSCAGVALSALVLLAIVSALMGLP